jgi:hypothetical protein
MNFIKKIIDNRIDEQVHAQFQKFSRGEFKNRAIVHVKKSANKCSINTSSEFSNELVKIMAQKLGSKKTKITGGIISTADLTNEIEFKEKKQFQGVKKYVIEKEMSGEEIIKLLDKFPKAFFALTFEVGDDKLKIKPKAPKSGKPGSKGEDAPKPDFCKLITNDKKIIESFVFEKPDFKVAEIGHTFVIEEIVIPEALKKSNDFAKIRENSLRKGKIIRKAKIDGKEIIKEIKFEA